jgi:hypothetical protein
LRRIISYLLSIPRFVARHIYLSSSL